MLETAIAEVPQEVTDDDSGGVWIEALPARIYRTPQYGEVPVPIDKLQRMITNFHQNVRGQEIATDFEHGLDQAKGLQASGWYRDFEIRPSSDDPKQMSLFAKVQFTDDAKKDIKDGKFKYWSLEWDDDYETDSGHFVPDVIIGGGLTNRPIAKRTMPINFSEAMWNELDEETQKQFAVWTTKYVNSLPDSAFLYIDSNGRHLPYKDANGKIDLPHLRNAAARANQIKGISSATVSRILARIKRLLGNSSKASELAEKYDVDFDTALWIMSETAAWEHSDPGIGAPLYASAQGQPDPGTGDMIPRVTGDPAADDISIGNAFRRDPLPNTADIPGDEPMTRQPSGRELKDGVIHPSKQYAEMFSTVRGFAQGDTDEPHLQAAINALTAYIDAEKKESESANADDIKKAQGLLDSLKSLLSEEANEEPAEKAMAEVVAFAEHILSNASKGGYVPQLSEQDVAELNELLGVEDIEADDGATFMPAVRTAFSELAALKASVGQSSQEKEFAEKFPAVWREHQGLLESNRTNAAVKFAESVSRINRVTGTGDSVTMEPTRNGLSAASLEQIAAVHKKFSDGSATLEDFEETVKTIVNGGVVEFGEVGSAGEPEVVEVDSTTAQGIANARKLFAEKVAEEQAAASKTDEPLTFEQAVVKTSEKYPDLAAAYRATAA